MDLSLFLLCWTPVILLTVLAVGFRKSALSLALYGFLFTMGLVTLVFRTPLSVALLAGVDGILTTLPLLLVIFSGILLSQLLMYTGSLKRIADWFMGGVRSVYQRNLLITLGVCNFMEGASVIAEPVIAPMLRASGVSPMGSAALSIIGYAGLMTLEMAGIIITVLSLITGIPETELGIASAWLSIPATAALAASVPFFLPGSTGRVREVITSSACGIFLGLAALGTAVYLGVSISGMLAGLALILVLVMLGPRGLRFDRQTLKDLSPFVFMLVCLLLVNSLPLLREWTFNRFKADVRVIPIHTITFRPLFSAYLYLVLAFLLSIFLQKVSLSEVSKVVAEGASKGWRAVVAMALFGAMGQMIAYSGFGPEFLELNQLHNIPWVLSHGLEAYAGRFYPLFVPFLGWVGTFLTGYGVASLMLFGQLQVQAAPLLGVSATWLSAGLAVGASVGSISSPFKIAIAAPMCGAVGREGDILRWTIPMGIGVSFFVGVLLWACL